MTESLRSFIFGTSDPIYKDYVDYTKGESPFLNEEPEIDPEDIIADKVAAELAKKEDDFDFSLKVKVAALEHASTLLSDIAETIANLKFNMHEENMEDQVYSIESYVNEYLDNINKAKRDIVRLKTNIEYQKPDFHLGDD